MKISYIALLTLLLSIVFVDQATAAPSCEGQATYDYATENTGRPSAGTCLVDACFPAVDNCVADETCGPLWTLFVDAEGTQAKIQVALSMLTNPIAINIYACMYCRCPLYLTTTGMDSTVVAFLQQNRPKAGNSVLTNPPDLSKCKQTMDMWTSGVVNCEDDGNKRKCSYINPADEFNTEDDKPHGWLLAKPPQWKSPSHPCASNNQVYLGDASGVETFAPTAEADKTASPTTAAPTLETPAPTTGAPIETQAPTVGAPTETLAPTVGAPTESLAPTTAAPTTRAPTTVAPTVATIAPTAKVTTGAPTAKVTTGAPTAKVTTGAPTAKVTTGAPTTAPPTSAPPTIQDFSSASTLSTSYMLSLLAIIAVALSM